MRGFQLRLVFTIALGEGTRQRDFTLGVLDADIDPSMVDGDSIDDLFEAGQFVPAPGVELWELRCAVRNPHLTEWVELRDDASALEGMNPNSEPSDPKARSGKKPKRQRAT